MEISFFLFNNEETDLFQYSVLSLCQTREQMLVHLHALYFVVTL